MTYTPAEERALPNYRMEVLDTDKLGVGFHEQHSALTKVTVFVLRSLESPAAFVRLMGCKDLANVNLYKWTDAARMGLDRHVVRKRNDAAIAQFAR